jgi:hypothetical protein
MEHVFEAFIEILPEKTKLATFDKPRKGPLLPGSHRLVSLLRTIQQGS